MTDHRKLIAELSRDAVPVRRPLTRPWRLLSWLLIALPCGALMSLLSARPLTDWSQPGAEWALLQLALCLLAGLFAMLQAFTLSIAGRRKLSWKWLLPLAAGWLLALLMGQATATLPSADHDASSCYRFMLTVSVPMVLITLLYLRRTRTLYPLQSLAAAGFGVACMAMALLMLCHPVHQHPLDLLLHVAAFISIIALTLVSGRWLVGLPRS
ncbi:DUF1109 family protein [Erwinia sp. E602]|uniref:NrsF family protein n=1 Tax=unclassified Erwinia TaxID=2622719 RepID=UPI0006F83BA3|nr:MULTISPECIES: NrsF family protein [unclassified Erwinia]KQN53442.1 hypothetical protein ASF13_14855 [Erwinia sp. Leaf53]PLV61908.1 membrane protein [Erwinia sp. B116]QUG75630.1 DUF1109 family protein [Erwinia sp. E602]